MFAFAIVSIMNMFHFISPNRKNTWTSRFLFFYFSPVPSVPIQSRQRAADLEPGSAVGFFLLKLSFLFPLSPACLLRMGGCNEVEIRRDLLP